MPVKQEASENKINTRNIVLSMLVETLENGSFSHIVVNETFEKCRAEGQERAFISRLYLGVLERLIYLDNIIGRFSSVPTVKMKPLVLNILRLSLYQLLFMDSVPDFAAISEAVKLTQKRGLGALSSFVNAVLRGILRECDGAQCRRDVLEKGMPENVRLSVPKWMYEKVSAAYGQERAAAFFTGALGAERGVTIRLNPIAGDRESIIDLIKSEGCTLQRIQPEDTDGQPQERCGDSPAGISECGGSTVPEEFACYRLGGFRSISRLRSYRQGLFFIQDPSSVWAAARGCEALENAAKGTGTAHNESLLIVDVCAAPGGKSLCAAGHFPEARVISRDISEEKVGLIRENAARLGAANIECQVADATVTDEQLTGRADMVIADLPCSGLGVIGGKPDIKLRVKERDIRSLAKLQQDILKAVMGYVKPGGILTYSTCTVTEEENRDNSGWLIEAGAEKGITFEMLLEEQILPANGNDGFYVAVFQRKQ